jgi:polysaccharide export outer membrane protein
MTLKFFYTKLLPIILLVLSTISCTAYKKLPYLKNVAKDTTEQINIGVFEPKIVPNDILTITVNALTEASQSAVMAFNLPLVPTATNNSLQTTMQTTNYVSGTLQNYIVQSDGTINFPTIGTVLAEGKTPRELQEYLAAQIYPRYVAEKPIINVRYINFQVSVLGEVNRPGTYNSVNGQMTIWDALAVAGDMTIFGKRTNVLLIRTNSQGNTSFYRINLQQKNILVTPELYYLRQNDKLYVETNRAKGNNSAFGTVESLSISAASILISCVSLAANIYNVRQRNN